MLCHTNNIPLAENKINYLHRFAIKFDHFEVLLQNCFQATVTFELSVDSTVFTYVYTKINSVCF